MVFQSTPPAEARGDARRRAHSVRARGCFNPLPPPKRGETAYLSTPSFRPGIRVVSIHSPRRSEGRHRAADMAERHEEFQSTPPAEARGDNQFKDAVRTVEQFQSTPPAEARGDGSEVVRVCLPAGAVSIHSPRRSEGRHLAHSYKARRCELFQSTPPAEARGDCRFTRCLHP